MGVVARSSVSMNYDGLRRLQEQLAKIDQTDEFFNACAKELAARLLAKAIKRTPVGDYRTQKTRMGQACIGQDRRYAPPRLDGRTERKRQGLR